MKGAFAGESQANRHYLYFAAKADVEGYNDVAVVFRSTAEGETGHAHGHLEYLEETGDPATGLPIGPTSSNLAAAIAGETHEYTDMYPGMAKTARDEAFGETSDWFETLAKAERSHANRLKAVKKARDVNIPELATWVDKGWDIVTPLPSCTLMFKQELPLMFPDDPDVLKVRNATFDPFEYLMLRHKCGKLKTDFRQSLGKVVYQVPCHLRVQNIGLKTRDLLQLVPDTEVEVIERCSGHDGTYAVRKETHAIAKKIARPVISKVKKSAAAGHQCDAVLRRQNDHAIPGSGDAAYREDF